MRAKINSGHGRHSGGKVSAPMKPGKAKVRTGFQALGGLNTSGSRRPIPQDVTTSPAKTGSNLKLQKAGIGKRGKPMY